MEVLTVLISLVVHIFAKRAEQPEADKSQRKRYNIEEQFLWNSLYSVRRQKIRLTPKDAKLRYFIEQIRKEKEWWLSERWEQRIELNRLGIDTSCPYVRDGTWGWKQEWRQFLGFREDYGHWVGDQEATLRLLKMKEDELEQRWLRMAPERLRLRRTKLRALERCVLLYGNKLGENSELIKIAMKIERERIDSGIEPEWLQVEFPRLPVVFAGSYTDLKVDSRRLPLPWRLGTAELEVCYGTGLRDSGFGDWERKHNKSGIEIQWLEMDQKWLELEFEHQQLLGEDLTDQDQVAAWQEMMQKWQEFVAELQEGS